MGKHFTKHPLSLPRQQLLFTFGLPVVTKKETGKKVKNMSKQGKGVLVSSVPLKYAQFSLLPFDATGNPKDVRLLEVQLDQQLDLLCGCSFYKRADILPTTRKELLRKLRMELFQHSNHSNNKRCTVYLVCRFTCHHGTQQQYHVMTMNENGGNFKISN